MRQKEALRRWDSAVRPSLRIIKEQRMNSNQILYSLLLRIKLSFLRVQMGDWDSNSLLLKTSTFNLHRLSQTPDLYGNSNLGESKTLMMEQLPKWKMRFICRCLEKRMQRVEASRNKLKLRVKEIYELLILS